MDLYYTEAPCNSKELLEAALSREGLSSPAVVRGAHGKPFLAGGSLFFNLTHTEGLCAVAVSRQEVGIDAERRRARALPALNRRLAPAEREEDIAELWTAKEAYVKYRGGTLAELLPHLTYISGELFFDGAPLPVALARLELSGCTLCICTAEKEDIGLVRL